PPPPLFPYTTLFRSALALDLAGGPDALNLHEARLRTDEERLAVHELALLDLDVRDDRARLAERELQHRRAGARGPVGLHHAGARSEEHTAELQSLTN